MFTSFLTQRLHQAKSRQAQAAHHVRVCSRRINNASPTTDVEAWAVQLMDWLELEARWRESCAQLAAEVNAEIDHVRQLFDWR